MTDYGHEVEFGLFPAPDAASAHHVLELAQVAEVSGLDLVTVQDHQIDRFLYLINQPAQIRRGYLPHLDTVKHHKPQT